MKKISHKIAFISILCTLVTGISIGIISMIYSSSVVTTEADNNLFDQAQMYSKDLSIMTTNIETLVHCANTLITLQANKTNLNKDLPTFMNNSSQILHDLAGNLKINMDIYMTTNIQDKNKHLYNILYTRGANNVFSLGYYQINASDVQTKPQDFVWFLKPQKQYKGAWSNVYYDPILKRWMISYCDPIITNKGEIGIVGVDVDFDTMKHLIGQAKFYNTGYAALVDQNYYIVAHPKYKSTDNLKTAENGQLKCIADAIATNPTGVITYTLNGQEKILAYAPVGNNFTVLTIAYKNEVMRDVNTLRNYIIVVTAIAIILLSLFAMFLGARLAKPIVELTANAEDIADGKFDKRVDIKTNDEVGRLADKFNHMTSKIEAMMSEKQDQFEQLTASHEELLATEEELRRLYKEVVSTNQKLEHSRKTVLEIFNAAGDGFVVYDREIDGIVSVNRRVLEMLGFSTEDFRQQGFSLISSAHSEELLAAIRKNAKEPQMFELETKDSLGNNLILEINLSPAILDGKDCCLALLRDVTARKQIEYHVEYLRMRDPLTGVFNRAHFEMEMLRIKSADLNSDIGILICDVDGLKMINDTLGHQQGDELLRNVAAFLQEGVQKPHFVSRIGGDEFAVLVFTPTIDEMKKLVKYYSNLVECYTEDNPHLPLSLSMGWAIEKYSDIELAMKTADNNMYRQKMHKRQSVRSSIVNTMMNALEARDYITEGHAVRMGSIMEMMGHKLHLPSEIIADLRLLAQFHDIGKVGTPDSILNKPGPLTPEEMKLMRQHCEIGYRIAKSSPDLAPIADWILKHQEHWDGNGYPLGLAGEEIPLPCRILALADAFDAMTNDRPYRKAMTFDKAIEEIKRCAGQQFDPNLISAFITVESELRKE